MKKSLLAMVSAVALLLPSCGKHGGLPPGNTIDNCDIESMTFFNNSFSVNDTLRFYYNPDGTPSHIDRAFVDDDSPKYLFRYDRQGRLLDYIGAFDNGAAEFWTRYFYDEATRTVIDTMYTLVSQYQTWPPVFSGIGFADLKRYDGFGRIVFFQRTFLGQVSGVDPVNLVTTQNYVYDRRGNVDVGQYDNKINFHRTNRVWQFVDNDYSNNNPLPVQQYNGYGLPTAFNFNIPMNENGVTVFFDLNFPHFEIHYSCDAPVRAGAGGKGY
jgi:hypothetical protein